MQHHCPIGDEIGDEHTGHADRDLEAGGDLDQRHRRLDELDDLGGFPPVCAEMLRRPGGGLDLCFETDLALGQRAAARHRIRPDQTSGLASGVVTVVDVGDCKAADLHIGSVHHDHALDNIKHFSSSRTSGVSTSPALSANTAIS